MSISSKVLVRPSKIYSLHKINYIFSEILLKKYKLFFIILQIFELRYNKISDLDLF